MTGPDDELDDLDEMEYPDYYPDLEDEDVLEWDDDGYDDEFEDD